MITVTIEEWEAVVRFLNNHIQNPPNSVNGVEVTNALRVLMDHANQFCKE